MATPAKINVTVQTVPHPRPQYALDILTRLAKQAVLRAEAELAVAKKLEQKAINSLSLVHQDMQEAEVSADSISGEIDRLKAELGE